MTYEGKIMNLDGDVLSSTGEEDRILSMFSLLSRAIEDIGPTAPCEIRMPIVVSESGEPIGTMVWVVKP